jgi:hypothetical protein
MTTILLLLWLVPIAINIYADRDGRKPNYLQMFVIRAMASLIHMFFFIYSPQQGNLVFWLLVFQITSWWLIFELVLNLIRGRAVFYFDRTENDSGWIDRFFAKKHVLWHFGAKLLCFAVMVYAIIRIYELH